MIMNILGKYFRRQLLGIFIMLLMILTGLSWMMQIMTMMKFLLTYGIEFSSFLYMTSLMVPFIMSIVIPFVTFIAVLNKQKHHLKAIFIFTTAGRIFLKSLPVVSFDLG